MILEITPARSSLVALWSGGRLNSPSLVSPEEHPYRRNSCVANHLCCLCQRNKYLLQLLEMNGRKHTTYTHSHGSALQQYPAVVLIAGGGGGLASIPFS